MIRHQDAEEPLHQAAALGGDAVEGEPPGHGAGPPLGLGPDATARLIQRRDRGFLDALAPVIDASLKARGARHAPPHAGRRGPFDPEQVGHPFDPPILRKQRVLEPIDPPGPVPQALWRRGRDAIGERRPRDLTALTAVGTMLGPHQRLRLRPIKHLSGARCGAHLRSQCRTTAPATLRNMIEKDARFGHRAQRLTGMTRLPAGRRSLQPITGWRLAAVAPVPPQATLQLRPLRRQCGNRLSQRRVLGSPARDPLRRRCRNGRNCAISVADGRVKHRRHKTILHSIYALPVKPFFSRYLGSYLFF